MSETEEPVSEVFQDSCIRYWDSLGIIDKENAMTIDSNLDCTTTGALRRITSEAHFHRVMVQRAYLIKMKNNLDRFVVVSVEPASSERKAAMLREIEQFTAILDSYVSTSLGRVPPPGLTIEGLRALPSVLIQTRLAIGMTQAELALRIGLAPAQICRYENSEYAFVALPRLIEIYEILTSRLVQMNVEALRNEGPPVPPFSRPILPGASELLT